MVPFSSAVELCKKLGLVGCLETSSRLSTTQQSRYTSIPPYCDDLDDAFFLCACNCVDQTTRDLMREFGVNASADPSFIQQNQLLKRNFSFQQAQKHGRSPLYAGAQVRQQQSEEGVVAQARAAHGDSLNSFRLTPAYHYRRPGMMMEYNE